MDYRRFLKYSIQLVLVIFFIYFIAMPAIVESPRKAYAEGKSIVQKRAAARKRTALKLLDRALNEPDEEKKQSMFDEVSSTLCVAGYSCTSRRTGGQIHQVTASRCKECVRAECLTCCDDQAANRPDKCKDKC